MARRRDPNEPESYPDYTECFNHHQWPSLENGTVRYSYVDEMAPQYAASALAKLRRWAFTQYVNDLDCERYWNEVQRTPLARALAARATSIEDLTASLAPERGYSLEQAGHMICRMALDGADDDEDPMYLVKVGTRVARHLYTKGYVIVPKQL